MEERELPPHVCLDLQIQLDHLSRANEQCRKGIKRVSVGAMTRDEYAELVRKQRAAQATWERKNRDYRLAREA